ncbi:MAG TPA: hypothetical protein H9814_02945 [Candidatus Bacteroides merdigallinarum]|uniref:Uncharacterized protein n=1 Tax=Candidatus Bacteroides merdigallinarum TaxID=2838473 RepID=A0A9D2E7N1_9BACE|nr:hypothetical protein [Candidatus Bacteroides merdigallinarum]
MKTITFIKSSVLSLLFAATGNSAWAQIKVENSTPEDEKVEYVYYTDGSSNFDYDRLWHDYNNEEMQLDYCKAFIGQKILCIQPGDVQHSTYQIKDIEGGEFLLDFAPELDPRSDEKTELGSLSIHKMGTSQIGQPKISKTRNDNDYETDNWFDALMNKKGERIGQTQGNVVCYTSIGTKDEKQKFFSQFLLIKGVYTLEEANRLIEESKEKLLSGKMYLPHVQKQIEKWEKKKQKGKLKGDELEAYQKLTEPNKYKEGQERSFSPWHKRSPWEYIDKYYKILFNGEEYYAKYLKGDTLIDKNERKLEKGTSAQYVPSEVCLFVEDNQGQEYFITFYAGSGCITEKHFAHVREQYVSQYVTKTYHGKIIGPDGKRVGPTMKCEDIVLRDNELQAKLRDMQTDEIIYVTLSYCQSSCSTSNGYYVTEENGAYFYLKDYETVVPENL